MTFFVDRCAIDDFDAEKYADALVADGFDQLANLKNVTDWSKYISMGGHIALVKDKLPATERGGPCLGCDLL